MWQRITYPCFLPKKFPMTNDYKKAMFDMVKYCKMDVQVLEDVYKVLRPYVPVKTHEAVMLGGARWHCPKCASHKLWLSKTRVSASGVKRFQLKCNDCGEYHTVSGAVYREKVEWEIEQKLL